MNEYKADKERYEQYHRERLESLIKEAKEIRAICYSLKKERKLDPDNIELKKKYTNYHYLLENLDIEIALANPNSKNMSVYGYRPHNPNSIDSFEAPDKIIFTKIESPSITIVKSKPEISKNNVIVICIKKALDRINQTGRKYLIDWYINGLSYKEICDKYNLTHTGKTVYDSLNNSKKNMKIEFSLFYLAYNCYKNNNLFIFMRNSKIFTEQNKVLFYLIQVKKMNIKNIEELTEPLYHLKKQSIQAHVKHVIKMIYYYWPEENISNKNFTRYKTDKSICEELAISEEIYHIINPRDHSEYKPKLIIDNYSNTLDINQLMNELYDKKNLYRIKKKKKIKRCNTPV